MTSASAGHLDRGLDPDTLRVGGENVPKCVREFALDEARRFVDEEHRVLNGAELPLWKNLAVPEGTLWDWEEATWGYETWYCQIPVRLSPQRAAQLTYVWDRFQPLDHLVTADGPRIEVMFLHAGDS